MIFTETKLKGSFVIEPEKLEDVRGFFTCTWSQREFKAAGIVEPPIECDISFSNKNGTLRGMHYQAAPYGQAKLLRCTQGAIYDVIIDLRPHSPTFRQWFSVQLTAQNHLMLYVPKDFAHGFQTLQHNTEVFYQMSAYYVPESSRGVRWNDAAFGIEWPADERTILDRDQQYPDFIT